MSRHQFVHAAALCVAILVLLLGAVGCAQRAVRVDQTSAEYPQADDAENAMATVEEGPPEEMAAPELPPPPPPPPPPPEPLRCCDPDEGSAALHHDARPSVETAAPRIDNDPFAGLGAFIRPPVWKVGNSYSLEFVVGKNEAGLQSVSEGRARAPSGSIWMAPTMRVMLDPNPNFEMGPQNPDQEVQDLSPDKTAAWFWTVKPLKPGKFTLVARVQALVRGSDGELLKGPDGKLKGRVYPPKTVEVQVKVGAKEKVAGAIGEATTIGEALGGMFDTWQKAAGSLAALITAIGGVWVAIRKLQGKPIRPRRTKKAA